MSKNPRRFSSSFSRDSAIAADVLFRTLLRGGDVSVIARSLTVQALAKTFAQMAAKARLVPATVEAKPGMKKTPHRFTEADLAWAVSVRGTMTWSAMAQHVGCDPSALRKQLRRLARQQAAAAATAEVAEAAE